MRDEDKLLEEKYAKLGIKVIVYGSLFDIKLDFTPEEWVDLINTEGEYLPICCANISRVRDIIVNAARHEHLVSAEELREAYVLLKDHGCETIDDEHPLDYLMKLWESVKDDVEKRPLVAKDINDPMEAIDVLFQASGSIAVDDLFRKSSEDQRYNSLLLRNLELARLIPAIRTLYAKIEELNPGPVEGWGIFKGDDLARTRYGSAIYNHKEYALEAGGDLDGFCVKPVRVTIQNGVEILDRDPVKFVSKSDDDLKACEF